MAREVEGKSVPDVIEFYYMWKKTYHYKQWKSMWRAEQSILHAQDEDSDEEEEEGTGTEEQASRSSGSLSVESVRSGRPEAKGRRNGSQHGRGSS